MRHISKLFAVTIVFVAEFASAETGLDFMRLNTYDQIKIVEPFIIDYVAEGYRNVPDRFDLSTEMASLIRKDGLGKIELNNIAREAAKHMGMSK